MSIRVTDPVCPQVILPARVTLFPSATLCVTNILSMQKLQQYLFLFRIELGTRLVKVFVATIYSF